MSEAIMTVAQTAEYLKVCEKTVRRLISGKKLAASKVGKSWRIRKEDIDKYLAETLNKKQLEVGEHNRKLYKSEVITGRG